MVGLNRALDILSRLDHTIMHDLLDVVRENYKDDQSSGVLYIQGDQLRRDVDRLQEWAVSAMNCSRSFVAWRPTGPVPELDIREKDFMRNLRPSF